MEFVLYIFLSFIAGTAPGPKQERTEITIVRELFRLRNEHKADSAEQYFADTVKVYMKYLRNVPKETITKLDRQFFKAHPKNKFEITAPLQIADAAGVATVTVYGKEYLDGTSFQYERIVIKFDCHKRINYFRGFKWKKGE